MPHKSTTPHLRQKVLISTSLLLFLLITLTTTAQEEFQHRTTKKYGVKTDTKVLIKPKYDMVMIVDSARVVANLNGLYGLIDYDENILLPFTSNYLQPKDFQGKSRLWMQQDETQFLYTTDGEILLQGDSLLEIKIGTSINALIGLRNGVYGAYDGDGNMLIPFEYDEIRSSSNGVLPYKKSGKWGILSVDDGHVVTEALYDSIGDVGRYTVTIKLNGKYGTIDHQGNTLIKPIYDDVIRAYRFNNAGLGTARKNGKLGLITELGEERSEFIYDKIEGFLNWKYDTILRVEIDGLKGTITPHGKIMIPPLYTRYSRYRNDSVYFVTKDQRYHGAVTNAGEVIIPAIYEEFYIKSKRKQTFRVMLNGKVGIVDLQGNYTDRHDTDVLRPVPILDNGAHIDPPWKSSWGYTIIDSARQEIVAERFAKIKFYNGTYGIVSHGGKYALIDGVGNELTEYKFDKVLDLRDSLLIVKIDGVYKLITPTGAELYSGVNKLIPYAANLYLEIRPRETILRTASGELIPFDRDPWDFSYPLLRLDVEGDQPNVLIREQPSDEADPNKRYKVVNIDRSAISQHMYEEIGYAANEPTQFLRDSNWYTLDANFEEIQVVDVRSVNIRKKYESIALIDGDHYAPNSHYIAALHGKVGVVKFNNSVVMPFIYDTVYAFHDRGRCAVLDGKHGFLDANNEIILPFEHDSIISTGTYLGDCEGWPGYGNEAHNLVARKQGKYGIFNYDGSVLTDFVYDDFDSSLNWPGAIFKRNGEWYVVQRDGRERLRPPVNRQMPMHEGSRVDCWRWGSDGY